MKISILPDINKLDYVVDYPMEDGFMELAGLILLSPWCPTSFSNNKRRLDNMIESPILGLDIDDGTTLGQALDVFSSYKHIIGTTKSHQKDKHGQGIRDRFRIVLFPDSIIKSPEQYKWTWRRAAKMLPEVDRAPSHAANFFYPCSEIVSINQDGKLISTAQPPKNKTRRKRRIKGSPNIRYCRKETIKFYFFPPSSNYNESLFKAACDMMDKNFTEEEVIRLLGDNAPYGYLDSHDLATIRSARNSTKREGE